MTRVLLAVVVVEASLDPPVHGIRLQVPAHTKGVGRRPVGLAPRRGGDQHQSQRRTLSWRVQRAPQPVVRLSVLKPLLLDLLLSRETPIGRVFFGSADVEAAALVRVRERVPDVVVLASRDDFERWHGGEVMDPLGIVGGLHLESGRGQQLLGAGGLLPANGRAPGQGQERGGDDENVTHVHVSLLWRWAAGGAVASRDKIALQRSA